MKEVRYFYCPNIAHSNELPSEEAEHAIKVLRLQVGDTMLLTDGMGYLYNVEITSISKKTCSFHILSKQEVEKTWKGNIYLAVAPTKNIDRIEWLVEKATEVGIDGIYFLQCQFSERKNINPDRLERITVSAMKQSHKAHKPTLSTLMPFNALIQQAFCGNKYIAHCYTDEDTNAKKIFLPHAMQKTDTSDHLVLIGPEGDFSISEVNNALQQGFTPITLGPSRLRTETAALEAVIMMNLNNVIL